MKTVTCVWAGIYDASVTVGKVYTVTMFDPFRMLVWIRDDDGDLAGYPAELFHGGLAAFFKENVTKIQLDRVPCDHWLPEGLLVDSYQTWCAEIEATITLSSGEVWRATFVCYEFIERLRPHAGKLKTNLGGRVFSRPGLVVVDELNESRIRGFIKQTIANDEHAERFVLKPEPRPFQDFI